MLLQKKFSHEADTRDINHFPVYYKSYERLMHCTLIGAWSDCIAYILFRCSFVFNSPASNTRDSKFPAGEYGATHIQSTEITATPLE
jgi:hypothetical protein